MSNTKLIVAAVTGISLIGAGLVARAKFFKKEKPTVSDLDAVMAVKAVMSKYPNNVAVQEAGSKAIEALEKQAAEKAAEVQTEEAPLTAMNNAQ